MPASQYPPVTKQNLTSVLAETGRINNADKFAAEGLSYIVAGIASRQYASLSNIFDDLQAGFITKDTYILYVEKNTPETDTAENLLTKNGYAI